MKGRHAMKIGTKLTLGFLAIVVIFGSTSVYQIMTLRRMAGLQDVAANKSMQALSFVDIKTDLIEAYSGFVASLVERDPDRAGQILSGNRELAESNISVLEGMEGTAEEKRLVKMFSAAYRRYLDLF
jgi:CHASE3 domain sensor protein